MTSTPSFTFFCYLLVFPLLVGFLFQEVSWFSWLLSTLFMVGLLRATGVHTEPSWSHTLSCACGLSSLRDEVQTLPGLCAESPVGAHTSQKLRMLPGWFLWTICFFLLEKKEYLRPLFHNLLRVEKDVRV